MNFMLTQNFRTAVDEVVEAAAIPKYFHAYEIFASTEGLVMVVRASLNCSDSDDATCAPGMTKLSTMGK